MCSSSPSDPAPLAPTILQAAPIARGGRYNLPKAAGRLMDPRARRRPPRWRRKRRRPLAVNDLNQDDFNTGYLLNGRRTALANDRAKPTASLSRI
ncbi:hypothetical protein SAMD00023353_2900420 [Rosellinia necatrix]|uniref:Uncharacterized protein n=1 Tax=Rosellinia necatrix TaxID=77044 RepID=A0A1S8A8I4_ROSNE|nr:hypothetical protein SAMD00023353_2900420 [Rosellinia necatrix]